MKNIRQYVLIAIAFILIAVVLVEHNIIQKNKNNLLDKDYEISKLKEELEDKTKEIEIYKETCKDDLRTINIDVKKCISKVYRTSDISNCILNSKDKWDKEIEKSLSELKKLTDKKVGVLLDNSQKDWEKYRDSQRKVIYNTIWNLQGTMHINISDTEAIYITEQRAKDLADILNMMKNGNYIQ